MNSQLEKIQEAAKGLFFLSESDYPFEVVQLQGTGSIESQLLELLKKPAETVVEKTTIDYFLRNMTRINPGADAEQVNTAQRFTVLENTLKDTLNDVQVYRLGTIQVDVFIIGKLNDGTYCGLQTKAIET